MMEDEEVMSASFLKDTKVTGLHLKDVKDMELRVLLLIELGELSKIITERTKYLSSIFVAEYLGVTKRFIHRKIKRGELKGFVWDKFGFLDREALEQKLGIKFEIDELYNWYLLNKQAESLFERQVVTLNDIAAKFNLDKQMLKSWIDKGWLKPIKIGTKVFLRLEDFLKIWELYILMQEKEVERFQKKWRELSGKC